MGRILALLYGVFSYLAFFAAFLYLIGFMENLLVPKSIDSGDPAPLGPGIVVNFMLVAFFGLQHSIMARPGFKKWLTSFMSPAVERSTFVLMSSVALTVLYVFWQPLPYTVWYVEEDIAHTFLHALFWAGLGLILIATFIINHFDLFGLRQVWLHFTGKGYVDVVFKMPLFYKLVRHPMMLGILIAFWATPNMTVGHLVFSIGMTLYVFVGTRFEERDLVSAHGEAYRRYQREVPMLIPMPGKVGSLEEPTMKDSKA